MREKEWELTIRLNNVEFKLAVADTPAKFEAFCKLYLAPLLLKLDTPHAQVRQKVIAICGHVNLRLKSEDQVSQQLPIKALVEQLLAPATASITRQFDLVYIHAQVEGVTTDLFWRLLDGLEGLTPSMQPSLYQILVLVLQRSVPAVEATKRFVSGILRALNERHFTLRRYHDSTRSRWCS